MKKQMMMLVMVILVFTAMPIYAAQPITILVNGSTVQSEVPPFIKSGITYVPIRFVSEALGAKVDWDTKTKTVTITKENIDKIVIDKPNIVNSRTFVPLRFVAEKLNCTVDWNNNTKTVTITDKDYVEKEEVINTIDSLGLERHKIADYQVLSKSDFQFRYFDSETETVSLKENVVFITPNDLPFQFEDTIIYSFDINGDIFTMEQQRLKGDNSAMLVQLAVKGEGIRRVRNDNYKHPTIDLGNGRILATYDEVALSDSLKFNEYESFKWEQVEYFILYSDEIPELIAIKNPLK
ncbi:MAG: copper amine oxidase N-terminal domain-containing protein [Clostridiales bacterium]|nr:copper amine oxidase N-terminal domain-containing protein [Clostridiales bacterium]